MLGRLSVKILLVFFVVAAAIGCLAYFEFARDDIQLVFFPLAVILFFFLPKNSSDRLPKSLILFCVAFWFFSQLGLEKFTEREQVEAHNFFARLKDDSSGLGARGFHQRFNDISKTYHLPLVQILHRSFDSDSEVRNWLSSRKNTSFVVRGLKQWLELVFKPSSLHLFENHPRFLSNSTYAKADIQAMDNHSLSPGVETFPVYLEGFLRPFPVVFQPEVVSIPNEPSELSLHLIAWVGEVLRVFNSDEILQWHEQLAKRQYAAEEASRVSGKWSSAAPIALAKHMRATLSLLEMLESKSVNDNLCKRVIELFFSAAAQAEKEQSPELFSSIFNNAGVTLASCAEKPEQIEKATEWFELAHSAANRVNPRASRAALFNIETIYNFSQ